MRIWQAVIDLITEPLISPSSGADEAQPDPATSQTKEELPPRRWVDEALL